MMMVKQNDPPRGGDGRPCANDNAQTSNDNAPPFDPKAWRRKYMREYMRRKREKERGGAKA